MEKQRHAQACDQRVQAAGQGDIHGFDDTGHVDLDTRNAGWRTTWNTIIPGFFIGNGRSQALLYDQNAGHFEVVGFDDAGRVDLDRMATRRQGRLCGRGG